jgi:hypothetical protein
MARLISSEEDDTPRFFRVTLEHGLYGRAYASLVTSGNLRQRYRSPLPCSRFIYTRDFAMIQKNGYD